MSEVAEKVAEKVMEMDRISEQTVDALEDGIVEVVEVVRNNPVVIVAAGVVGLIAGGVGGYFLARNLLRKEYEELASEEIAEAKQFYANLNKVDIDGTVLTPQEVMDIRHGPGAAAAALREYQGSEADAIAEAKERQGGPWDDEQDEAQIRKIEQARIHSISVDAEPGPGGGKIEVVEKVETRNVFADPTFDLAEEIKHRTEEKPYIITHDEYFEAEKEYDTQSLTYYEVDEVLTDERDKPIENVDELVGEEHLTRFGSGSKDNNVVYIRNDKMDTDYEIIRSHGSYLEEVLGMPQENPGELKHSDQRDRRRALRFGDG